MPPNANCWIRCSSWSGISAWACSGVSGTCGIGGSVTGGIGRPGTIVGTAVGTAVGTTLGIGSGTFVTVGIRFSGLHWRSSYTGSPRVSSSKLPGSRYGFGRLDARRFG